MPTVVSNEQAALITELSRHIPQEVAFNRVAAAFGTVMNFAGYPEIYQLALGQAAVFMTQINRIEVAMHEYVVIKNFPPRPSPVQCANLLYEAWEELQDKIGNRDKKIIIRTQPTVSIVYPEKFALWCEVGFVDTDVVLPLRDRSPVFHAYYPVEKTSKKTEDWMIRWKRWEGR